MGAMSVKLTPGQNLRISWGKYAHIGPGFPSLLSGKPRKMPGFAGSREIDIMALIAKMYN